MPCVSWWVHSMAVVYGRGEGRQFVALSEDEREQVTVTTGNDDDGYIDVTVDAEELARALFSASPSFTKGVAEIAQRAILSALSEEEKEPAAV